MAHGPPNCPGFNPTGALTVSYNTAVPVHQVRPGVIPAISPAKPDEAAALAQGWHTVETISDALALARHYVAGLATTQQQLAWIKANCQVIYHPPSPCLPVPVYPVIHCQPADKDNWDQLMAIANQAHAAPT